MNGQQIIETGFRALLALALLSVSCMGPEGTMGADGNDGPMGQRGPQGEQGATGAQGEPGVGLDMEIVEVDDTRLVYSPAVGCGPDEWCEQADGWSQNRLAAHGRYTSCAGEADCSSASVVLELDDNQHSSVVLSHWDSPESGIIIIELSFDGGANYSFHKAINTRRVRVQTPHTATQRTIASNLPAGEDVRVRLIAAKGRMNIEGFGLSSAILTDGDGPPFRSLAWASANGPGDGTCESSSLCPPSSPIPIDSRQMTFVKTQDETAVRVQYTDNLRTNSQDGTARACRWAIRFNSSPCPDGDIIGNVYASSSDRADSHETRTVAGYCPGLPAGTYTVQVFVSSVSSSLQPGCYTGWHEQRWLLEAEEIQ